MPVYNTISHEIAATLRDEILSARYLAEDRLPSERDLASRFGASRGAVREAISQLEQLGLIRVLPGGARVQAIESASLAILGPLLALDNSPNPDLVDHFLRTFAVMAALTGKMALEKATDEELNRIDELLVNLSDHTGRFVDFEPHLRELYEYLSAIADNLVVRLIGNDLKAQFVEQMMELGLRPAVSSAVNNQLVKSLQIAAGKRDGDMAAEAIQEHFDALRSASIDSLSAIHRTFEKEAV